MSEQLLKINEKNVETDPSKNHKWHNSKIHIHLTASTIQYLQLYDMCIYVQQHGLSNMNL